MAPQSGYSTDSLVKANVRVNGEEAIYFDNPFDWSPPGYPDNTFRIFHYLEEPGFGGETVWIDFDLDGGSPDPVHPDAFTPRNTVSKYKQGDAVDALEFEFFDEAVPVKAGSTFKGWKYELYDDHDSTLLSSAGFDFGDSVPLGSPAVGRYRICFVADWGDGGADPPPGPAPIESIELNIRNFVEGNTFQDLVFGLESVPAASANMQAMRICYLKPSGQTERIGYGAYVIDSKFPYWFELYFFPMDGFHANDLTGDDIDAFIDGAPAKAVDLENPCPPELLELLPAGASDDTFLARVVPWESALDEEKAPISWSFDLDGGAEPDAAPGVFALKHSSYLYKQGDVVDAEEFAYFEGIKPVKAGYVFKGWRYRLHEREYQMDGAINPDPLGKYTDGDVPYDTASGVTLDEALSGLPESDFPKTYHIAFKVVWEEECIR